MKGPKLGVQVVFFNYFLLTSHFKLLFLCRSLGYTATLPTSYYELEARALAATQALSRKYNTVYQVGSATNILCEYIHFILLNIFK